MLDGGAVFLNLHEYENKPRSGGHAVQSGMSGFTVKQIVNLEPLELLLMQRAKIQIMRDADADLHSATRPVELIGSAESINKAEKCINDVNAEADAGGSPSPVARGSALCKLLCEIKLRYKSQMRRLAYSLEKVGKPLRTSRQDLEYVYSWYHNIFQQGTNLKVIKSKLRWHGI